MSKTAFSAQDQHVFLYSYWGATRFSFFQQSAHKFVQNSVFSPRSARTVIFALGAPLFDPFQQSTRVFLKSKTAVLAQDHHVLSFLHCAHHLLAIFSKVHKFVQTAFSALDQHVLSFSLCTHHFLAFSAKCRSFYKTAFLAGYQDVLSFSHCLNTFFAIFRKVHDFLRNKSFEPESSTFCHFLTGRTSFLRFYRKYLSLSKTTFSARDQHVLSFLHWVHHFFTLFSKVQECAQRAKQRF